MNESPSIPGYRFERLLHRSADTLVHAARRLSDEQPVVLKFPASEYPRPRVSARLRREYELARELEDAGVVRALALEKYGNGTALVLEDFGGRALSETLDGRGLPLERFLELASRLSALLGEIHARNVIHKDLKPANIIIKGDTVKIADFGIASRLSREQESARNPGALEGTLAYMSPEQTGRMNRSIDYRSDFYSLGATFYEMLTGSPPFASKDPMELVHCHIARNPPPPETKRPDVPPAVSAVVMKLLAKTAEDRYQSSFGLRSDLETCRRLLRETGEARTFELGTLDRSEQFRIRQKLYGREDEIAVLLSSFRRVCEGDSRLMLVAGYSGIGKSALVGEVQRPVVENRAYFISGKFDQFKRDIPYSAVIQAFQELARQLLTEEPERIEGWKERLLEAMGSNGGVITDVIPEIELIIGEQPPVPPLGPTESQNRFNLVFRNFVGAFARKEHPLVIFLDDLQWADAASLKLIHLLMTDQDTGHLLMLGAYRDNEVDEDHPLMGVLSEIEKDAGVIESLSLAALRSLDVAQLIADSINLMPDETTQLAELVFDKTSGNPFFVSEFLKTLYYEKYLTFDFAAARWTWDMGKIRAMAITDNVVELMAGKIRGLPRETMHAVRLASCIGNIFDLKTISIIQDEAPEALGRVLDPALKQGLLLPIGDAYKYESTGEKIQYRFPHDRVQQAAYGLIPEEERAGLHLNIGRHLMKHPSKQEREGMLFDIVNHLNAGSELITDLRERIELAELNGRAGRKAKQSTAYEPALNFLRSGRELLPRDAWREEYELALDLHVELAEAAMLNSRFRESEEFQDEIIANARDVFAKSRAYDVKIRSLNAQNRLPECLSAAREILRMLDVKFPENPGFTTHVGPALLRAKLTTFLKGGARGLFKIPRMKDPRKIEAMRILMNISSTTYQSSFNAFAYLVMTMVYLSYRYGNAPQTPYGIALYALAHAGVLQDFKGALLYSEISLELQEKVTRDPAIKGMVLFVNYSFVRFWRDHMREMFAPLTEGAAALFEAGNNEFAGYIGSCRIQNMLFSTEPLPEIEKEAEKYFRILTSYKQNLPLNLVKVWGQFIDNLSGRALEPGKLQGRFMEADDLDRMLETRHFTSVAYAYICRGILRYHFGEYETALMETTRAFEYEQAILALAPILPMYFYDCLIRLALARTDKSRRARSRRLRPVRRRLRQLRKWAGAAPHNKHHVDLVEAEIAFVKGAHDRAAEKYRDAVKGARECGYKFNAALANELAGEFHLARGREKEGREYLRQAIFIYEEWGGKAKVAYLRDRHGLGEKPGRDAKVARDEHHTTEPSLSSITGRTTSSGSAAALDLATVMKSSRAISGEIRLEKLLEQLMRILIENAGAERGVLILNREGRLFAEAEYELATDMVRVGSAGPIQEHGGLALTIINYVERTRENLIITDAHTRNEFARDAYIRERAPRSILCAPILNGGRLIGLVYLENNLTTGAFTDERVEILRLLSAQAAVSLENAALYSSLEMKVEERTTELRASKREIDDIMANVRQGLLTVERTGAISSEYSRRVAEIFERDDLGGRDFAELFTQDPKKQAAVREFLEQLFSNPFMSEKLFQAANPLNEHRLSVVDSRGEQVRKVLEFSFSRILGAGGKIEKIMVVVEDRTENFELKQEMRQREEKQAAEVEKLYRILRLPPGVFSGFMRESRDALDRVLTNLESLENEPAEKLDECYREIHTLKGNARAMNLDDIGVRAHELEDVFEELKQSEEKVSPERKERVRLALNSLLHEIRDGGRIFEKIMGMQSALGGGPGEGGSDAGEAGSGIGNLEARLRDVVRSESRESGSPVEFEFLNALDREPPRALLEALKGPLSHILRNSMVHGIESPEARQSLGKRAIGRVRIALRREGDFIICTCRDDGSGLKTEAIRAGALKNGLITAEQAETMGEAGIHKLIFASGLSTASELTESAGRGVGMAAVRSDLKAMNAVLMIASRRNQYTRFTIKVPLSPASSPA